MNEGFAVLRGFEGVAVDPIREISTENGLVHDLYGAEYLRLVIVLLDLFRKPMPRIKRLMHFASLKSSGNLGDLT
jgi:hypothetical protein